ncbi:beta-1,4-glucuronyltransferase 1-like [Pectinophora gossypiella]|uniref:N-acetyllactosaminide beta-1,3-N-acetylglucosaminyltransferase n=1 Tax=Pectinophora gossypiella TaxID=13191 RepID=A0A1E1WVN5_PECGO|nr:beta-1,4-glucuronyltransferase 1-like [Pectinophora gossypiella]
MLGSRRNLIFRLSIAVSLCMMLYAAMHLSVGPAPGGEWVPVPMTEDVTGNEIHTNHEFLRNDSTSVLDFISKVIDDTTSQKTPSTLPATSARFAVVSTTTAPIEVRSVEPLNENLLTETTLSRLKELLGCKNREFRSEYLQRGEYWVLSNYVRADHGPLDCYETITYTTHSGFQYLDNVLPVVERWAGPVSLAIHAPGSDLKLTLDSIKFLRQCTPSSHLVRKLVTFHIFFPYKHMPSTVPKPEAFLSEPYTCPEKAPYVVNASSSYKEEKGLLYPINVARNLAREAALTHFILPSDIELYPSPNIIPQFLNMIARNQPPLNTSKGPRVFPISLFEVDAKARVPSTKTELLKMLSNKTAITFHKYMCQACHNIPQANKWMARKEEELMNVLTTSKRKGKFARWEPIYIGTHQDPYYDERLSWEGMKDKMSQGYVLCVMDYDFMVLNKAFLVHKPGIKKYKKAPKRMPVVYRQNAFVSAHVLPELKKLFGSRANCVL